MTVQTDFLERCKALNLHDGKLSDWLDEIESLRQQLAAALAACNLKDMALERIASINLAEYLLPEDFAFRVLQVRKALAIQPDDSALKVWLGEPLLCREDGRCQYAIDHGAEGMGHCPEGKCCMPRYSPKGLK